MGLITIAFIRIHMVSPSKHFFAFINYNMIFQNHHLAKLIAENICKTTTCKEHYPDVQNEDDNYDFLMLSEKHIKVSIVLQGEISDNFKVLLKLNKVTGSDKNVKEIGEVSMKFVAPKKCIFTLSVSPTPPGHSNKEVSKEIPLG